MFIYYLLIMLSVVLFGGSFGLKNVYRAKRGSGLKISAESMCIGGIAGLIIMFFINGLVFEFTPFTMLMASLSVLNSLAFSFCSFKALDYINLSLFSVFTMLGGMVLPFLQGLIFYNEKLTLAKIVCIVFICLALACTLKRGEKKNGTIFYIGIFILNGMSGVISKLFTSSDFPKTSPAGYSILSSMVGIVASAVLWLVLSLGEKKQNTAAYPAPSRTVLLQSYGIGALSGAINKVANFVLVFALMYVDASVQYPMVTGGTMIVSTLLCYFGNKKPSKMELISVVLSFIGMLALFAIPI